jgi:predicted nucleotidyltransferase
MVRRKDIEQQINGYMEALRNKGISIEKVILFGSYAKGKPHAYSDIDLAVWSKDFTDDYFIIIEDTSPLKRYYKYIELHPFNEKENALNNPFIREIEKTGIVIKPNEIFTFD